MDVVICLMGETLLRKWNVYLVLLVGGEYPRVYLIVVFFLELDHSQLMVNLTVLTLFEQQLLLVLFDGFDVLAFGLSAFEPDLKSPQQGFVVVLHLFFQLSHFFIRWGGTLKFQLKLLAFGVFLAKEFYLFFGDSVPSVFNGIRTLVLSLLQIQGVSMLEFLELSASVIIPLEDDLVLHFVFISLFLKFLLLSLDSADLVEVLLLKLRAFFFGLLDDPDLCLLLGLNSNDLGLEDFLLLLDELLM